jgi:hypothetical protein
VYALAKAMSFSILLVNKYYHNKNVNE